ncbi:MAG: uroporphyrinogen-III synthase [Methanohalobium sp.]|uniref:uroporphyrinogen-III synthase n=1 Tax=Methanohalobium sp. TaxID=2837493 RepID=UPI00397E4164
MASDIIQNTGQPPVLAIMRPEMYLDESVTLAQEYGFETFSAPMIEIVDKKDDGFDDFVHRVIERKSDYVIFTSANGIDFTLRKIPDDTKQKFLQALNSTNVVAIGPNTQKALTNADITCMDLPESYSSEGVVDYLRPYINDKVVDIARSSYGSSYLISGLIENGATVFETQVYTLNIPDNITQKNLIRCALAGKITVFAFTSSMIVHNFFIKANEVGSGERIIEVLNSDETIVSAIGAPTANTLKSYGVNVDIIPEKYLFENMLSDAHDIIFSKQ